jgi:NOL1/NOP2/fmu family ribosome biogenesis protein
MQKLIILNTRKVKEISKLLKKQFNAVFDFPVVMKSSKEKIYLINRDVSKIDLSKLKIDVMGLYFGEIKTGELRLSIEGAQLIGPLAKKNVLEINDKLARLWLKGYDLPVKTDMKGFLIVKNNDDYLGCGKFKENKILNFIPKTRRILADD